ncbi:MFS transporter [Cellulomonas endometrii]|uniref:MFS transporter n=1 Tax=Cellulomonas endometrii TaxID=3036301 RepID=UPI0024AD55C5|nr:MFS transporter [Cellulomonas endometrii]
MSHTEHPPATSAPDRAALPRPSPPSPSTPATTPRRGAQIRLAVALVLGGALWIGPFVGMISVLLPAQLEIVAPDRKVSLVATLSIVGSIVALLANILFGALSDLTRSRMGKRAPWMILGSVMTAAMLVVLSRSHDVTVIVVIWCVFQLFLNAIVGPIVAIVPDRVQQRLRGTYSAIYGVGVLAGSSGATILASRYITDPTAGMLVLAGVILLAGPVVAVLAPDRSNTHEPRAKFSRATLLTNFTPPRHDARDFYLALAGKLLFVLSMYAITGYQLYILTDYLELDGVAAGAVIATMATVQLVLSLVFGAISGPISDRIGRRKPLVVGSALLMAAATSVPFFWQAPAAMIVFAVVGLGIASGVYNSVDQALNYEVLPDPHTAAKDLGMLNMANTGGQILGPVLTSAVVAGLGSYRPVFLVAALVGVASALLIAPIRRSR